MCGRYSLASECSGKVAGAARSRRCRSEPLRPLYWAPRVTWESRVGMRPVRRVLRLRARDCPHHVAPVARPVPWPTSHFPPVTDASRECHRSQAACGSAGQRLDAAATVRYHSGVAQRVALPCEMDRQTSEHAACRIEGGKWASGVVTPHPADRLPRHLDVAYFSGLAEGKRFPDRGESAPAADGVPPQRPSAVVSSTLDTQEYIHGSA